MRYYKTCEELPLSIFIDILETDNLSLLIKWGYVRNAKLVDAWDSIFEQYNKLIGNRSNDAILRNVKYVSKLKIKIKCLNHALTCLAMGYHLPAIQFLNRNGIRTRIKRATFVSDFKKARTEVKSMISHLEAKQKELDNLKQEEQNIKKDFTRTILMLSQFLGYAYKPNEHTVFEFCMAINLMNETNAKREKNNRNNRSKSI